MEVLHIRTPVQFRSRQADYVKRHRVTMRKGCSVRQSLSDTIGGLEKNAFGPMTGSMVLLVSTHLPLRPGVVGVSAMEFHILEIVAIL